MAEKTINYIKLPDGETYRIGGGSGFNLFDTKISDHVLEGQEALGWALMGTYVTKTDYPDAYNKILNKYNDPNNTVEILQKNYSVAGELSQVANGYNGFSTSNYAYTAWSRPRSGVFNIKTEILLQGSTEGSIVSVRGAELIGVTADRYITFSIPMADSTTAMATGTVALSTNVRYNVVFERTTEGFNLSVYNGETLIDSISFEKGIDVGINLTHDIYAFGVYLDSSGVASKPFNGVINFVKTVVVYNTTYDMTVNAYLNSNKWRIYDTTYKTYVDSIYESTGIADYYGIDLVNERIFLPRNDKFIQLTSDTSKVNDCIEAGLPNITGTVKGGGNGSDWMSGAFTYLNSDTAGVSGYHDGGADKNYASGTAQFNASNSNSIYGNSDTVQPPSSLKLLYYCVGNTKVESTVSNVTEITTSENDTLPLFYNFYSQEDMTTTGAYVNASLGSWLSGNVYTTAYNELVNKLGTDNVKANTDTYTDYDFVLNQDDMTFRLPLKNGQEIMFATGVKGNGKSLGLTDGTVDFTTRLSTADAKGYYIVGNDVALGSNVGTTGDGEPTTATRQVTLGLATDSSKSGIELDTENITIPDGWNLYYKVANAVTNLELLDVGKVMNAVNSVVSDNSSLITNYLIPDYSTQISTTTSGYTCPYNCFIVAMATHGNTNANSNLYVNGISVGHIRDQIYNTSTNTDLTVTLYASEGDVITWEHSATIYVHKLKGDM